MKSEDLIGLFKAGDRKAFNEIFDLHYPALRYYSIKLTKSQFDGEEIALDSFDKLFRQHNAFESLNNIKAFLYKVARNDSFNFLDRQKTQKKRDIEFRQILVDVEDDQHESIQTEIIKKVLENVEKYLPQKCRQIVKMRYVEGKSRQEIADELMLSINTVDTQIYRAIRILTGLGIALLVIICLSYASLVRIF